MNTSESQDYCLLKALQKGNEIAFTTLFHRYNKWLHNEALFYCHHYHEAEDIVQEVFITLWISRKNIHPEKNISNFLYIAMRNICINRLRRKKVEKKYMAEKPCKSEAHIAPHSIERTELGQQIREAINSIPAPASRNAVKMLYIEEKDYSTMAMETGVKIQTLRNAVSNGLIALRKEIKKQTGG